MAMKFAMGATVRFIYATSCILGLCRFPYAGTSFARALSLPSSSNGGRRRKGTAAKWIACRSTIEVTRAIETYVREGDAVAELGSQLRDSSAALCEAVGPAGSAVLADVERKFPDEAKGEDRTRAMRREGDERGFYEDRATFVEMKSFESWRQALFFRGDESNRYNALVVDVGACAGNDLDLTCVSLAREFLALNRGNGEGEEDICRVIIVKSGSLQRLARRLYHAQRVISGAQSLERRHPNGGASIIGAVGVKQYRETIPFVVEKGDVCVEVGCHLGTTTALIDEAARGDGGTDGLMGGCIGVDVCSSIVKSARKKYPRVSFEVGDGFKIGELARMEARHFANRDRSDDRRVYDVVYVDIGGLSGSEGLLEAVSLLASISNGLEPRCIVIKSLCIRRLASCLVPFSEVWSGGKSGVPNGTRLL
ncbi:hypothetical protein ACHAWF_009384 [Thalassiosira exigua]